MSSCRTACARWGASAFASCSRLSSVDFGHGLETIGASAFESCYALTRADLPDTVTTLGNSAFSSSALHTIHLGNSLRKIGAYALSWCPGLRRVTLPESVETIGTEAFSTNDNLQYVSLPGSAVCSADVFYGCPRLAEITVTAGTGAMTDYNAATWENAPWYSADTMPVIHLSEGIRSIGAYSFYGYENLRSLIIPSTVTAIGSHAFDSCSGLESITFQSDPPAIAADAFAQVKAEAFYPRGNAAWTEDVLQNYGGALSWYENPVLSIRIMTPPDKTDYLAGGDYLDLTGAMLEVQRGAGQTTTWDITPEMVTGFDTTRAGTQTVTVTHLGAKTTLKVTVHMAVVTFKNDDGSILDQREYMYNDVVIEPEEPSHPAEKNHVYLFTGWTPYVRDCTGDAAYTATYRMITLETPVLSSVRAAAVSGKPRLTWSKVNQAENYAVYRSSSEDGTYRRIDQDAQISSPYEDTTAEAGHTYYYKLRALLADGHSYASKPLGTLCTCSAPVVTGSLDPDGKPVLTWPKVAGADSYEVYRAEGEQDAYQLLTTVSGTRLRNGSAKPGHTYFYKVKALHSANHGADSSYSEACQVVCGKVTLAAPVIHLSIDPPSGKPVLTWDKVAGAREYEVWRSTESSNSGFSRLFTTSGTRMRNGSAKPGHTYFYKVRALAGGSAGGYCAPKSATCDCAAPVVRASTRSDGKPVLTWDTVEGAGKYEVWRRVGTEGEYQLLFTTTGTRMTNGSARDGETYYYKVKALCASNPYGDSAFSETRSVRCGTKALAAPAIRLTGKAATGKPCLTWDSVDGAEKYEVWRAVGKNGQFQRLFTTTGNRMTNGSAEHGVTYYYKVRAIAGSEKGPFSTVKHRTCDCARPEVHVSYRSDGRPVLLWDKIDGAVKYEVYFAGPDGEFTRLTTVSGTRLSHGSAKPGLTYQYKVRAVCSNSYGNSAWSTVVSAQVR